ncbi:hypothetical protein MTO96_011994 [Rhipicephalus appendiculatus]
MLREPRLRDCGLSAAVLLNRINCLFDKRCNIVFSMLAFVKQQTWLWFEWRVQRTRGSFNPQSRNFRESPGSPPLLLCPSACRYDFDLLSRARLKKRKKAPSRRSGSRSQRPAALTFAARPPLTSGAPAEASFRRVEEAKLECVRRLPLSRRPLSARRRQRRYVIGIAPGKALGKERTSILGNGDKESRDWGTPGNFGAASGNEAVCTFA